MEEFLYPPRPKSRRWMEGVWRPRQRVMEKEKAKNGLEKNQPASSLARTMDAKVAPTTMTGRYWMKGPTSLL